MAKFTNFYILDEAAIRGTSRNPGFVQRQQQRQQSTQQPAQQQQQQQQPAQQQQQQSAPQQQQQPKKKYDQFEIPNRILKFTQSLPPANESQLRKAITTLIFKGAPRRR